MDSAKANRIAVTVVIILIIAGTAIYLIYDQIQPKNQSKVEVAVQNAPQQQRDAPRARRERASQPGEPLPQLNLLHLDGTPLNLSDYSGKIVFLHIWSTTAPLSLQEFNQIKPIYDKFLLDSRMVMLGISDSDAPTIKKITESGQIHWPQAMALPNASAATKEFLSTPGLMILGKDGSIIARPPDWWEAFCTLSELLPRQKLPQPNGLMVDFEQIPNQPTNAPQDLPFTRILAPSAEDAATSAKVQIVEGRPHGLSGGPDILLDGRLPSTNDSPPENFFFIAKSIEGRLLIDLNRVVNIRQINSYTWHAHERSPQVFRLYGSEGLAHNFLRAPKFGLDPAKFGWSLIADVNTHPAPWPRGITGISLHQKDPANSIGAFRYLLLLAFPTETHDAQGHTFFSEIDVIEAK